MRFYWAALEVGVAFINIFMAFGFLFLLGTKYQLQGPEPLRQAQQIVMHSEVCRTSADVLSYALQLGRLDFVSMALTCFGGSIAILGLAGFWMLRREAIHASIAAGKKETVRYLRSQQVAQLIEDHVTLQMQGIIERYTNTNDQRPGMYDDIAQDIDILDNRDEGKRP